MHLVHVTENTQICFDFWFRFAAGLFCAAGTAANRTQVFITENIQSMISL